MRAEAVDDAGTDEGDGSAARWCVEERALWRCTPDGTLVVLGEASDAPLSVRATGAAIWEALGSPRRLDDVVEMVASRARVPPEVVRNDIVRVVEELAAAGAVRRVP